MVWLPVSQRAMVWPHLAKAIAKAIRWKVRLDMSLFEEIQGIICEQLKVSPEGVRPETSFLEDLGADSLDTIQLVMELEGKFNLEIPDADTEDMDTVDDVVKYIEKKLNKVLKPEK